MQLVSLILTVLLWLVPAGAQEQAQPTQPSAIRWETTVTVCAPPGSYGASYGRILQLDKDEWLAACTVSPNRGYRSDPEGGLTLAVFRSKDRGRHWKQIAQIADPGRDLDNAAFARLPDGSILLACRSVRWQESYRLPVYRSRDGGATWKQISVIDSNEGSPGSLGHPDKGVYEPHFCFLPHGQLAVMYANEKHVTDTDSYSQIVSEKVSPDNGKTWGKEIWVAYRPGDHASRPGMPVWTRMKDGRYMVVFEVCGPEGCNVYYKTSDNGTGWATGLGTRIPGQTGAPYVLALKDGRLLVTSNRANVSVSDDAGRSWRLVPGPWARSRSYEDDWTALVWSALYQTGRAEVAILTSVLRKNGGHKVMLRFGRLR